MQSKRRNRNIGLEKALKGGSSSPHPHARSVVAGFERFLSITEKRDISDWLEGEIRFGFIEDGSAPKGTIARLKLKDANRHILILGPTGSGKTMLTKVLSKELMEHIFIMIFDITGDHVNAYTENKKPYIIPIKNIRINPNEEPPGVPYDEWAGIYPYVLGYSLKITDVSIGSFVQLIRYSEERFKVGNGLRCSIYELRSAISEIRPKSYRDHAKSTYWSRLEDRFDSMLSSTLGNIFACYKGHDIIDLLNRNIIFDCRGVSSQVLRILIPIILLKIYCYRLYCEQSGMPLHGIILEEAESVFSRAGFGGIIENPLDQFARRIRGRSEFLICINQTRNSLSDGILSNSNVQFMLGATDDVERSSMGRSMGLRNDQWEDATRLKQPYAFVAIEGKEPLLVSIPKHRMSGKSPDADRIISSPDKIPYIPVSESVKKSVFNLIISNTHKTMAEVKEERELTDLKKVSELLHNIAKEPFIPLTSRTNLSFGNSRSGLFKIMLKAIEFGFVNQVITKAKRGPGQRGIYLEITRKGMDFLIENGLWKRDKPYYSGKMGFAGALLLHGLLVPYFEETGKKVLVESLNRGYDADIGIIGNNDSLDIACELSVFTSAAQEIENVRRNFATGWKEIICVVVAFEKKDNEITESELKTKNKIKAFTDYFQVHLSADEMKRVKIMNIREFRIRRKG